MNLRDLCRGVQSLTLTDTRFKTAQITVGLFLPLSRDTVEEYAILPRLMARACASYPDFTALNRRLNELYGASVAGQVMRIGEAQGLLLTAECTDDRYALDGERITAACAELLCDMLFSPAFENGCFRVEDVETERRCLAEEVRAQINDKRWYARRRAEQVLCEGEAYSIGACGQADVIEALTPERVTAAWRKMLKHATVRLILQGPEPMPQVEEAFRAGFSAVVGRDPLPCITDTKAHRPAVRRETERMEINQSKLVMGFRTDTAEPDADVGAMRLMNAVLGGTPSSLLFRNVREKLSLCYYCSSAYDRMKGILLVQSGVDEANAVRTEEEVLRQVEALAQGNFTDEDVESARRLVLQSFEAVGDSQSALAAWYVSQTLLDNQRTPDEVRAELAAIDREAIIRAAKKLRLECVYLLAQEEQTDG